MWIEGHEKKEKEKGVEKHAKLVEARAEAQGRVDPLIGLQSVSKVPHNNNGLQMGVGEGIKRPFLRPSHPIPFQIFAFD